MNLQDKAGYTAIERAGFEGHSEIVAALKNFLDDAWLH